jgi:hypothetical protein
MCAATGAQALALSTVHFDCSADTRLVAAGGTLANLIFGVLFWVTARAVKQISSLRYFFWLLMTFNLLDAGGYFLFSGIGNIGDWAAVVAGWQPAWAWRVGLTVVGALPISYCLCLCVCASCVRFWGEMQRFVCGARANSRSCLISLQESSPVLRAR